IKQLCFAIEASRVHLITVLIQGRSFSEGVGERLFTEPLSRHAQESRRPMLAITQCSLAEAVLDELQRPFCCGDVRPRLQVLLSNVLKAQVGLERRSIESYMMQPNVADRFVCHS